VTASTNAENALSTVRRTATRISVVCCAMLASLAAIPFPLVALLTSTMSG
jgi:hypothetical protein